MSHQNQILTQQHNWKKGSSSPRVASVLYRGTHFTLVLVGGKKPESRSATSEQVTTKEKVTTFMDKFAYPHSHSTMEMAITLKSDKAFEEFT
jgi:hypothetical protein